MQSSEDFAHMVLQITMPLKVLKTLKLLAYKLIFICSHVEEKVLLLKLIKCIRQSNILYMTQFGLMQKLIQVQDVLGVDMMLQAIVNSLQNLLIRSKQRVKKLEFMHQNICGNLYLEVLQHVKVSALYHYGMLITIIQHHFQTILNLEDGQNLI